MQIEQELFLILGISIAIYVLKYAWLKILIFNWQGMTQGMHKNFHSPRVFQKVKTDLCRASTTTFLNNFSGFARGQSLINSTKWYLWMKRKCFFFAFRKKGEDHFAKIAWENIWNDENFPTFLHKYFYLHISENSRNFVNLFKILRNLELKLKYFRINPSNILLF